jgi:hypothetical protein
VEITPTDRDARTQETVHQSWTLNEAEPRDTWRTGSQYLPQYLNVTWTRHDGGVWELDIKLTGRRILKGGGLGRQPFDERPWRVDSLPEAMRAAIRTAAPAGDHHDL